MEQQEHIESKSNKEKRKEKLLGFLIISFSFYGFYGIYRQITSGILQDSPILHELFFWPTVIALYSLYMLMGNSFNNNKKSKFSFNAFIITLLIVFFYGAARSIYTIGDIYNKYIAPTLSEHLGRVGERADFVTYIFLFMLVSSAVIYRMRCRRRLTYGSIELIVGLIQTFLAASAAFNFFLNPSPPNTSDEFSKAMLQVIAGMYIVVRGLDNMEQGAKSSNNDPIKKKISTLFDRLFRGPLREILR